MNREINCLSDDEYLRLLNTAYPSPPKDKITSAVISRIKKEKITAKRLLITRYAGLAACFMLITYAGFRILPMLNVKTATANDSAMQTEVFDESTLEEKSVTGFAYTVTETAEIPEDEREADGLPAEAPASGETANGAGKMMMKSSPAMLAVTEESAVAEPEAAEEESAELYEVSPSEPTAENRIMRSLIQPESAPICESEDCSGYSACTGYSDCSGYSAYSNCTNSADCDRSSISLPITVLSIYGEDMDAEAIKKWIMDGGDTSEVNIHALTPQEYLAMTSRATVAATSLRGIIIKAEP